MVRARRTQLRSRAPHIYSSKTQGLRRVNPGNSWMNPKRAVATYAIIFSMFIVWASARTAIDAGSHGVSIRYIAGIEIAGAILFIWRKTRPLGLTILLVVFAI